MEDLNIGNKKQGTKHLVVQSAKKALSIAKTNNNRV